VSGPRGAGPGQLWRNLRDADWTRARTPLLAARNLARRLRGHACCGHPGEPGC
jgi:hypothetical protein